MENTRIGTWSQEIFRSKAMDKAVGVMTFAVLTALGAYVYIPLPFTPVPITLQTFFVLFSGLAMGPVLGATSQLAYLLMGIIGMPFFSAGGAGFSHILGPTGGYLIGFVLASWVTGKIIQGRRSTGLILFSLILGAVIYFSFGLLNLSFVLGCGIRKAMLLGFIPFIPGDILKIIISVVIYKKSRARFDEIFADSK